MNMGLVIKQFLNSFTSLRQGTQQMFGTKIVKLRMTKYGKSASVHYYKFVSRVLSFHVLSRGSDNSLKLSTYLILNKL